MEIGALSLEVDTIVFSLSVYEIWPVKRGSLWWECTYKMGNLCKEFPYRRGTTVYK
jgi:hypothetical protein